MANFFHFVMVCLGFAAIFSLSKQIRNDLRPIYLNSSHMPSTQALSLVVGLLLAAGAIMITQ